MSQENVEVIRALYDGWLRGDMGLDKLDPEIAMFESSTLPGAVSAVGLETRPAARRSKRPGSTAGPLRHGTRAQCTYAAQM